jgi:outer membrane protein
VEAGALPLANRLDIEAQFANDELAVVNAENQLTISLLNLKQVMLLDASVPLDIEEPSIDLNAMQLNLANPGEVFRVAVTNQPSIRAAEFNYQAAEFGLKSAKGSLYPTLAVGYSAFTNYSDIRDQAFRPDGTFTTVLAPIGFVGSTGDVVVRQQQIPGGETISYTPSRQFRDNVSQSLNLSLNIPVFNRFQSRNAVARAKVQLRQAEIQTLEAKQTLRQSIETAYTSAIAASKSYQANTKRVAALEESFRAAEARFNAGAVNAVDYQVATNNLFQARNELIRAKYEFIFRTKLLEFFMGKPLTLK